ncbi:MAG TPA: aminopeptidase, partial [Bacteroidetes bacterium]|nr:aminopeptidase [Bacteroidota bacterium]
DFTKKVLAGKASLFFQNKTNTDKLVLDTRGLIIKRVTLGTKNQKTTFRLGEPLRQLGQALLIDILPETKLVNIWYESSPGAGALQWFDPQQTTSKTMPFLYTQSQPILARTWIPCQDNPGVRMTYRARIRVPIGMLAVMSAQNPVRKSPTGVYDFYMPQPIPSYLMALAVGDIEFRKIGERSGVYAEPEVVEKAAWEFADVESMMVATEHLYGPYRWQRYDVMVLPQSFPLGGMENPRLTFATPTILAGDRSLVSLITHELAHSWAGNLVTNATWNDIWLSEGIATYIEQRVVEAVFGHKESEMQASSLFEDLKKEMDFELGPTNPDTRLRPDFADRNLEDVMNGVPYGKGYLFLRALEETVGRERWDNFLRKYFDTFAFQSMTTDGFVSYLNGHLLKNDSLLAVRVPIEEWLYKPGLPASYPKVNLEVFGDVEAIAKSFLDGSWTARPTTIKWSAQELQHFLLVLPRPLTLAQMRELDSNFTFTASKNSEILKEWFLHAISSGYAGAFPALENFLVTVGRLKYLRPLYTELARTPEGVVRAQRIYENARPGYHPIAVRQLDRLLR